MSLFERRIPRNLNECCQTNEVSEKLFSWSQKIEILGGIFCFVLCLVGIIATIWQTYIAVEVTRIDEDLIFITVVSSLCKWGLYAIVEYVVYTAVYMLIDALASIVHNTTVSAQVAVYSASRNYGETNEESNTVKNAAEKTAKTKEKTGYSLSELAKEKDESQEIWYCTECGSKNYGKNQFCKDCGTYR